ncbi:hypothetical protein BGX34_007366, partial [Mortierella sp. NVP85]
MASIVSQLKASSTEVAEDPTFTESISVREYEQRLEQAKDSLFRDVAAVFEQLSNRGAMVFGTIISSPRASLSLQQVLRLANVYLENARQETDPTIALVLCHDAEVSLSQVKRAAKYTKDKDMREGIASIYNGLGDLLDNQGCGSEAQAFYNKSAKW